MSDEDERITSSQNTSVNDANNRRLFAIKSELHKLTREKTKYNVEKLTQDAEFLHNEIGHLTHEIAEINKEINGLTSTKKTLNAQIAILRSNSRIRYTNLQIALQEKQRYEEELEKPGKNPVYRKLAQDKINSILECLPQLEKLDEYNRQLQKAEDDQTTARNKREKFVEILNEKIRKQAEIKDLLYDGTTRLPELEQAIANLRSEREQISTSMNVKKQRPRISPIQHKPIDSPVQSFASLEHDTLEHEKQQCHDQLEKIHVLLKYFQGKMSEHNLSITNTPNSTPTNELISPLYQPVTPLEEKTKLSSFIAERIDENNSSQKITTSLNQSTIAIAMKLPRNFTPLNLDLTTTNEIIHSPYHSEKPFEYKKELPADIVDKYAGTTKKKQQQQQGIYGKKNKKNKKNFGMKHSSQMIYLYNEVRTSTGNSDALPFMPMFEYELPPTVKALQLIKQSGESYFKELLQRNQEHLSSSIDEQRSENLEDDDIQDSALDTYSEASSIIESTNFSKDLTSVLPQLTNIPEARSSSSSDDKKTVVSSSSPPSSHHSHSKTEPQSLPIDLLTTVEELPPYLPPLTIQIAQIERQISDEGYRSIRNDVQQQITGANNSILPLLTRSSSYDCTEKVDKWLSSTTLPSAKTAMGENLNNNDFQATDNNKSEENLVNQ